MRIKIVVVRPLVMKGALHTLHTHYTQFTHCSRTVHMPNPLSKATHCAPTRRMGSSFVPLVGGGCRRCSPRLLLPTAPATVSCLTAHGILSHGSRLLLLTAPAFVISGCASRSFPDFRLLGLAGLEMRSWQAWSSELQLRVGCHPRAHSTRTCWVHLPPLVVKACRRQRGNG